MSDQDRIKWELAGLVAEDGRLGTLQGYPEILAPPTVDVIRIGPEQSIPKTSRDKGTYALAYPVPEQMHLPMTNGDIPLLLNAGWRPRRNTPSLLDDFISLGQPGDGELVERVRSFAVTWGPLWVCSGNGYDHIGCHWSMQGGCRHYDPCSWINTERVEAFVIRAREAKAALDAGAALKDGKAIPGDLLPALGLDYPWIRDRIKQRGVEVERILFCEVVNRYLGLKTGGPGVFMNWLGVEPTLGIASGFGFIRAVWLGIAQTMTSVRRLYTCSECQRPYARRTRQPRKGERNLCPQCGSGGGYRATKRRWWNSAKGAGK